ncbi:MAG: hypothetical protein Tsb0034_25740 [Ekhidna sp.]
MNKTMAKKAPGKNTILKAFQDYILEEGHPPETVRIFTKYMGTTDEVFYKYFGSLNNIETAIWEGYYTKTLDVLHKDPDFQDMTGREKHLSFLYTFAELLKPDRSYILYKLEGKKPHELPEALVKTKKVIDQAEIDWAKNFEFLPEKAQNMTQKAYKKVLWSHTIATLFFWVKDDSGEAKDTDIFIEKSTRTAFDIGELPAIDSLFDLSKFFLQKMGFSKATA